MQPCDVTTKNKQSRSLQRGEPNGYRLKPRQHHHVGMSLYRSLRFEAGTLALICLRGHKKAVRKQIACPCARWAVKVNVHSLSRRHNEARCSTDFSDAAVCTRTHRPSCISAVQFTLYERPCPQKTGPWPPVSTEDRPVAPRVRRKQARSPSVRRRQARGRTVHTVPSLRACTTFRHKRALYSDIDPVSVL